MIKAILIDDEEKAIQSLTWEINNFCKEEVSILKTFNNPIDAINYLKEHKVDCVFLDIEMPTMGGLQLLNFFPDRSFEVIFTTAYDQYAINAIKNHAFDYLLKPIDSDDLQTSIKKLQKHLLKNNIEASIEDRIKAVMNKKLITKKITLSIDGAILFIEISDVIYCKSDGNYCEIFLNSRDKKLIITQKIKYMEELLPGDGFMRVHNSYLVNLNYVTLYHKADGLITLKNGKEIPVSRQKKTTFLDKIQD